MAKNIRKKVKAKATRRAKPHVTARRAARVAKKATKPARRTGDTRAAAQQTAREQAEARARNNDPVFEDEDGGEGTDTAQPSAEAETLDALTKGVDDDEGKVEDIDDDTDQG